MLGARGAFGSSLSEPRSYNEAEVEFSFNQPTIDLFYQPWRSGVRDSWKKRISGLIGWLALGKAKASTSFTVPQISLQIFLHIEVTFE